ncbi:MAG: NAD(P)H-dependent oxidoreductase subunit E [Methanomassiliicoccales archaeon]
MDRDIIDLLSDLERTKENVLPALQEVQRWYRYLPEESLDLISEEFGVPLAKVVGIATFYSQFTFEPQGEHIIRVCRGTACHIKGADIIIEYLQERYGLQPDRVSEDGKFVLTTVRCLGCCAKAPVMMIDDEVYGNLDEGKIAAAVDSYQGA